MQPAPPETARGAGCPPPAVSSRTGAGTSLGSASAFSFGPQPPEIDHAFLFDPAGLAASAAPSSLGRSQCMTASTIARGCPHISSALPASYSVPGQQSPHSRLCTGRNRGSARTGRPRLSCRALKISPLRPRAGQARGEISRDRQTLYQILSGRGAWLSEMGPRVELFLPRMRVTGRLTHNNRRTGYYPTEGEWELSVQSGKSTNPMASKEVTH